MIEGEAWVHKDGKEYYSEDVIFVKIKDCNYDKNNFKKLIKEWDDNFITTSEIDECYMRFYPKGKEDSHYGSGESCWIMCKKGNGAVPFYFAEVK